MALVVQQGVAIITGGANGIGKASALMLAQAGAAVAVLDRDVEAAERTADRIRSNGGTLVHAE